MFCSLAQRTGSVFASQGVPVYLFSKITPTPFVVSTFTLCDIHVYHTNNTIDKR